MLYKALKKASFLLVSTPDKIKFKSERIKMTEQTKNPTKFDNLRFRPFLVIEMWYSPAKSKEHGPGRTRTEQKGWWNIKENVKTDEVPSIVNHISSNTLQRATVIIDIVNDVVLKNTVNVPANAFDVKTITYKKKETDSILKRKKNEYQPSKEQDEEVLKHFKSKYADMIGR
jgi:hypothetical protein